MTEPPSPVATGLHDTEVSAGGETSSSGRMPRPFMAACAVGGAVATIVFALVLSGGHADGLWREGPYTSDFFDVQAHALVDGHLDVDPEVVSIEGFVDDDGRTHLYFGLVPSVARMPIAWATDSWDGRLTQLSMLLGFAVALWASARLVWRGRRAVRGERPLARWEPWVAGSFVVVVGLGSPLLFLAARPLVYHEAEMWGSALALVSAEAVLAWWERPTGLRLVGAGAAATLAFNTRPSVGSLGVLALGLAVVSRVRVADVRATAAGAVAVVVPVATYAWVNWARFGQLFSAPFESQAMSSVDEQRQAVLAANDGTLFNVGYIPTTLWHYLRPDGIRFQRLFPFVTYRDTTAVFGDVTFDVLDRSASLPVVAPVLFVLAVVGVVACVRRRAWPWLVVTAAGAAAVVSTLAIALIAQRYLADFTPFLVAPAALGVWACAAWCSEASPQLRRATITALAVVGVFGLLVSLGLTLTSQRLLLLPSADSQVGFLAFAYDLDERWSGGSPPGVSIAAELPEEVGNEGDLVIVGECSGLYRSTSGEWRPIERAAPLAHLLEGPAFDEGDGEVVLVDAGEWFVSAEVEGDSIRLVYAVVDSGGRVEERHSTMVPVSDASRRPLLLITDPSSAAVELWAGDRPLLVAYPVAAHGAVRVAQGWGIASPPTPLCDDLARRLRS